MAITATKLVDQLLKQIREVEPLGWTVRPTSNGSYLINNGRGQTATISATRDRRGQMNAFAQLDRLGLTVALMTVRANKENGRVNAIATDRAKQVAPVARFVPPDVANAEPAKTPTMANGSKADGMRTVVETITPDAAMEFLTRPPAVLSDGKPLMQRPLKESHVERLALAIERGEWMLTPQGIVVATDGGVLDGQHRLHAIVLAEQTVDMFVTYGVSADVFAVLDTGIVRTAADVMRTKGEKNSFHLASAAKLLFCYNGYRAELAKNPEAKANWPGWARGKPTHVQLAGVVDDNLRENVQPGLNITSKLKGNGAAAIVFRTLVCEAIDKTWPDRNDLNNVAAHKLLQTFCELVQRGEMIGKGHPAYATREWLQAGAKGGGSNAHARREIQLIALLKAWRRFCKTIRLEAVRVVSFEAMPLPYVPKDPIAATAAIQHRNTEGWGKASAKDDDDE